MDEGHLSRAVPELRIKYNIYCAKYIAALQAAVEGLPRVSLADVPAKPV